MKRLTQPFEKYIPTRIDWLKHDFLGGTFQIAYILCLITLGVLAYFKVLMPVWALYGCITLYIIWAALTAYNEYHQGKTGTGEKSFKDWLYGMRNPTMGISIILLSFFIFS